ncbi:unnamed protein product, partial [Didymodactylos carnosus]
FEHKTEFMLDSFDLKEGKDFFLNVNYNQNNSLEASVKCNCTRSITLTLKAGKIQLSNFQKHLRTTNCNHIKSLKKIDEEQKKQSLQQFTSTSSSSTIVPLTSTTPAQQQPILQVPAFVSTDAGASSVMTASSSSMQSPVTHTNSQKRGQPSSQFSSSQKTKRSRT